MRWAITLTGEHTEGIDARDRFETLVAGFSEKLKVNGFLPHFADSTLDLEDEAGKKLRAAQKRAERATLKASMDQEEWRASKHLPSASEVFGEPTTLEIEVARHSAAALDKVRADMGVAQVTNFSSFSGRTTIPSAMLFPEAPLKSLTLKEIRARIKDEKAALGGNKILSQVELAKRIGVSRDRIRQALK